MWHISRQGQTFGPYDTQTIDSLIRDQRLGQQDHIWRQGFDTWRSLADTAEFGHHFQQFVPPPPPTYSPSSQSQSESTGVNKAASSEPDTSSSESGRRYFLFAVAGVTASFIGLLAFYFWPQNDEKVAKKLYEKAQTSALLAEQTTSPSQRLIELRKLRNYIKQLQRKFPETKAAAGIRNIAAESPFALASIDRRILADHIATCADRSRMCLAELWRQSIATSSTIGELDPKTKLVRAYLSSEDFEVRQRITARLVADKPFGKADIEFLYGGDNYSDGLAFSLAVAGLSSSEEGIAAFDMFIEIYRTKLSSFKNESTQQTIPQPEVKAIEQRLKVLDALSRVGRNLIQCASENAWPPSCLQTSGLPERARREIDTSYYARFGGIPVDSLDKQIAYIEKRSSDLTGFEIGLQVTRVVQSLIESRQHLNQGQVNGFLARVAEINLAALEKDDAKTRFAEFQANIKRGESYGTTFAAKNTELLVIFEMLVERSEFTKRIGKLFSNDAKKRRNDIINNYLPKCEL